MTSNRRLWTALSLLLLASFSVLLWMGREIYHAAPPVPERVVTAKGALLFERSDIETGRIVWQTTGGQQLGSIWGHGAFRPCRRRRRSCPPARLDAPRPRSEIR